MYTAEDIKARLRERPFRPLRFIVSKGLKYDIPHPDLVFVGRHDVQIGFSDSEDPSIYDRVTRVTLVHIVAMEDLPVPAAPDNGQQ
jgi:hypothetical protein